MQLRLPLLSSLPLRIRAYLLRTATKHAAQKLAAGGAALVMEYIPPALASNPSFTPLFRLLDDFEHYSRRHGIDTSLLHPRHCHDRPFAPRFDLRGLAAVFELDGELPGVRREDLTVEVAGPRTLVVRGSVRRPYAEEEGSAAASAAAGPAGAGGVRWLVSERGGGAFERSFGLPADIDQAGITAALDAGVLCVRVPKARGDADKTRRINIS